MKRLPRFWKRISRHEEIRSPGRKRSERYWKKLGEHDVLRKKQWPYLRTPLKMIEEELGTSIQSEIQKKLDGGKKRINILDAGCGYGVSLNDLKNLFEDKVRTVGLTLRQNPGIKYTGVDKLVKGRMSQVNLGETFDIIYSFTGAHFHTKLRNSAIENTISMLKPDGIAVLHMEIHNLFGEYEQEINELKTLFAINGIKDWKFIKPSVLYFKKPKPKLPN